MSKIYIVGTSVTITSDLALADLQRLARFNPEALKRIDPETKDEVFRVGVKSSSISANGISFNEATANGKATMTVLIPGPAAQRSKFVVENYGKALIQLDEMEIQMQEALNVLDAQETALISSITVVDEE